MREIRCTEIVDTIREMCMEAACFLSDDMKEAMNQAERYSDDDSSVTTGSIGLD